MPAIPWELLEEKVESAVINCADKTLSDSRFVRPPHFVNERSDYGELLDHVLVNWPYPRERLMYNPVRRSLIRKYAKNVRDILYDLYDDRAQWNDFHTYLTRIWNHRAKLYFDSQDVEEPYIIHEFSSDHHFPFTTSNPVNFNLRRLINFQAIRGTRKIS